MKFHKNDLKKTETPNNITTHTNMERLINHIRSCRETVKMHQNDPNGELIPSIEISCFLTEEEAENYPTATKDRRVSFKNFSRDIRAIPSPEVFWPSNSAAAVPEGTYRYIIWPTKMQAFLGVVPSLF